MGIDLHRTVIEQLAGADQCPHDKHEAAGQGEWQVSGDAVLQHHGIDAPFDTIRF
ncbi:hypothetical protein [Paraburkholderia sacchari]|uniref:hypothetical protein n=1 Tax=Paraburkholderia sacchari TaxID=159450 RepID=UPI0039A4C05E